MRLVRCDAPTQVACGSPIPLKLKVAVDQVWGEDSTLDVEIRSATVDGEEMPYAYMRRTEVQERRVIDINYFSSDWRLISPGKHDVQLNWCAALYPNLTPSLGRSFGQPPPWRAAFPDPHELVTLQTTHIIEVTPPPDWTEPEAASVEPKNGLGASVMEVLGITALRCPNGKVVITCPVSVRHPSKAIQHEVILIDGDRRLRLSPQFQFTPVCARAGEEAFVKVIAVFSEFSAEKVDVLLRPVYVLWDRERGSLAMKTSVDNIYPGEIRSAGVPVLFEDWKEPK